MSSRSSVVAAAAAACAAGAAAAVYYFVLNDKMKNKLAPGAAATTEADTKKVLNFAFV